MPKLPTSYGVKQAEIIPFCEDCQTSFKHKCKHQGRKVFQLDPIPDKEIP